MPAPTFGILNVRVVVTRICAPLMHHTGCQFVDERPLLEVSISKICGLLPHKAQEFISFDMWLGLARLERFLITNALF